jgi:hypothetical protein
MATPRVHLLQLFHFGSTHVVNGFANSLICQRLVELHFLQALAYVCPLNVRLYRYHIINLP